MRVEMVWRFIVDTRKGGQLLQLASVGCIVSFILFYLVLGKAFSTEKRLDAGHQHYCCGIVCPTNIVSWVHQIGTCDYQVTDQDGSRE